MDNFISFKYVSNNLQLIILQMKLKDHTIGMRDLLREEIGKIGPAIENRAVPERVDNFLGRYSYGGKFWMVPEGFAFPKGASTFQAFTFWFRGMPEYQMGPKHCPIAPFKRLAPEHLPPKICLVYRNEYLPCMKMLVSFVPQSHDTPTTGEIREWFDVAMEGLKEEIAYIFTNHRWATYTVGSMAKKMKLSQIIKYGTPEDKVRARNRSGLTHRNKVRQPYRARRR